MNSLRRGVLYKRSFSQSVTRSGTVPAKASWVEVGVELQKDGRSKAEEEQ